MRGYFEYDPVVLAQSNALDKDRAAVCREYPEADASEVLASVAFELDSILAGFGYGKAERLTLLDREAELSPAWEK